MFMLEEQVFTVVEKMPEFPGGDEALAEYLENNLEYPEPAVKNDIKGTVIVTFIVKKSGKVTNAKVVRGIGYGCDEEALRLVNGMPQWIPGEQRGKPVRVQFNLPIRFEF
jgi:protein TonB